jgi:hypothetical protein
MRTKMLAAVALMVGLSVPLLSGIQSAATTTAPPCTHLVVAASSVEHAAGTGSLTLLVANTGARCQLEGWPKVVFFNSQGVVVAGVTYHQPSMVFAMPRPKLITLAPGNVASIGLSWSDTANGNATCRAAAYASVSLPKGIGRLRGYLGLYEVAPCGGWLRVTPIEMGAVPRASW